MSRKKRKHTGRETIFVCHCEKAAAAVFLAGDFNDWSSDHTPMTGGSTGEWSVSLRLPPGRYEYKFVVDGLWTCVSSKDDEPDVCSDVYARNPFGTWNRVIEIA